MSVEIGNSQSSNGDSGILEGSAEARSAEVQLDVQLDAPPKDEEISQQPSSPVCKRPCLSTPHGDVPLLPDPSEVINKARKLMNDLKMTQVDLAFVLKTSAPSVSRLLSKAGEPFFGLNDHNRQLLIALDEWMKTQPTEATRAPVSEVPSTSTTQVTPKPNGPAICVTTIPGFLLVFKKLRLCSSNGTRLFDNATLSIAIGRRYGLIGSRYSGSSALLTFIENAYKKLELGGAGVEIVLCNYSFDNDAEILTDNITTVDYVVQRTERWNKLKMEETSLEKVLTTNKSPEVAGRLKKIYEQLHFFVAGDAELKARILLTGLGFPVASQNGPIRFLSENDRKVAKLAQCLLTEPDLLLLDQPTTSLDIDSVKFLENYLKGWRSSLIVITQDRAFLDAVCSDIIQVRDKQLFYYEGSYSSFVQQQQQQVVTN